MNPVSASKLKLARKCVFPWTSNIEWTERPGWSARLGTCVHYMAETGKKPDNWGTLTDRQREIAEGMYGQFQEWSDAREADLVGAKREVAFWYCPANDTAGILEQSNGHRDYSKAPPGAMCATLDLVAAPGASFDLVDIKTGWAPEPPDQSDQLKFQGLVVAKVRGLTTVNVGVLALRERDHAFMRASFSELTLDLVASEAKRVHLAIQAGEGPTPGDHCKHCPIREECEASTYERPTAAKNRKAGRADEAA